MAKIYGLFGTMTGKTADVVMVVRNGEQIVRKYQPVVANPSTEGQVEARAKLKLMSQLSAVMAPYIAIPRRGNVSSRNLFVKKNYPLTTFSTGTADITLTAIQITDSVVGLPALVAARTSGETGTVEIQLNRALQSVNRVVYVAFSKGVDNKLRAMGSSIATQAGTNGSWPSSIVIGSEAALILAYGVRDNTDAARAVFGNLVVMTSETVAKLIVSRTLTEADITLTETAGIEVAAQQN